MNNHLNMNQVELLIIYEEDIEVYSMVLLTDANINLLLLIFGILALIFILVYILFEGETGEDEEEEEKK